MLAFLRLALIYTEARAPVQEMRFHASSAGSAGRRRPRLGRRLAPHPLEVLAGHRVDRGVAAAEEDEAARDREGNFSIQKPRLPIRKAFTAPAFEPRSQTKTSSRTPRPDAEGATNVPNVITADANSTSLACTFWVPSDIALAKYMSVVVI
jgi:hypothetical protein